MTAPKPEWIDENEWGWDCSYKQIVEAWSWKIVEHEAFGSYQGDEAYLLLNEITGEYGLIVFGYGSCSGCDALQAVQMDVGYSEEGRNWQPLWDLSNSLRNDVHWEGSLPALANWIDAQPENHWWAWDVEIRRWLNEHLATGLPVVEDDDDD